MKILSLRVAIITTIMMVFSLVSFIVSASDKKDTEQFKLENPSKISVTDKNNQKVIISIVNFGRSNPFQKYVDKSRIEQSDTLDNIPAPPDLEGTVDENYSRVISSRVNGILYDPDSKSTAIVNIGGADYMVHKGDKIEGIIVDNITKEKVVLRYGTNTYGLKVGEIVEGNINNDPVQRNGRSFGENIFMWPDAKQEGANNS